MRLLMFTVTTHVDLSLLLSSVPLDLPVSTETVDSKFLTYLRIN
ncbi:hypothetical protein HBNXHr_0235 [Halorhabdus sp. BNX81]|nr:hypothetical protein HBNXHr_0235 [Halorhabdus sp. BNX81]